VAFSFVSLILLVDNALAQEKTPLENISLIVGIVVGIATIAAVIIAYLSYKSSKKVKDEKQPEGQKIIVDSESTTIGKSKIEKQEVGRDSYKAERDIIIQQPSEKGRPAFPSQPSLHNQTPPEPNFVGREDMLETLTDWYTNPEVRVGALIGWGGVGKSAIVRKWYDTIESNAIKPDGIFWWGFYRNAYLEQFLNALLRYVSQGQIEPETIKSTWEKTDRIKEYIHQGAYLIILDGLEQMQKPASGDEFGKMIHRECTELLHYLADVPKGLCLITTRYPLIDLEDWHERGYEKKSLIDLSVPDSLLMLRRRGVKGREEDMTEVINRYKGHALSLTSVAGYLKRYYDGDIKQAPEVEFVLGDKERFKDVNELLRKYAEKMFESERIFLNIFSLFRTEVTKNDFAGVFWHEIEDTKFNDVLVKMSKLDFRDMINDLVDWQLISYDETKKAYATHPLIKGYFKSDFDDKNKKLYHKRIYQYFGEYAPEQPETLEEMQSLFEQVYHGCAAGLYDEVYNLYDEKIERKEEYFITHKLGAWEADLSLIKSFFPKGGLSQLPLVSKKDIQSELLNDAGLALLNTGQPQKAEDLIRKHNEIKVELKDWKNASVGYCNLADIQYHTGELEKGLESAKKGFDTAEEAKSHEWISYSEAYLAWIHHLLGKSDKAGKEFRGADELQRKITGNRPHGGRGVFYADFLISIKRFDEALEFTRQNLEICQRYNSVNSISRCHRCLAAIERIRGNHNEAEVHLQNALEIARKIGVPDLEIEALLESGRLQLDMERHDEEAIRDATKVLKICNRTGFKLYEPEAEVVLGKAYLALNDLEQAKTFAHWAYEKAIAMHYRWQEGDAAHLLGEIYLKEGAIVEAREWLEKAVGCRKEISDPKVEESERILKGL
jgi:tetratricopeptide (TPR) repeat protein